MNEFEQRIRKLTLREPGTHWISVSCRPFKGQRAFAAHESDRAAHVIDSRQ